MRIALASVVGVAGLLAYVVGAASLFDEVQKLHPVFHLLYFLTAGLLWTLPVRSLMYWAAR